MNPDQDFDEWFNEEFLQQNAWAYYRVDSDTLREIAEKCWFSGYKKGIDEARHFGR